MAAISFGHILQDTSARFTPSHRALIMSVSRVSSAAEYPSSMRSSSFLSASGRADSSTARTIATSRYSVCFCKPSGANSTVRSTSGASSFTPSTTRLTSASLKRSIISLQHASMLSCLPAAG